MGSTLFPILWFVAILAMIPLALWLLKRTPIGGSSANGVMKTVAVLPLSPSQRLVTVEVGQGDERRWLVLGVTSQQINCLHTMAPQGEPPSESAMLHNTTFSKSLSRFFPAGSTTGDRNVPR